MHRQWLKRKRVSPASFNLIGTAAGAFPLAGYAHRIAINVEAINVDKRSPAMKIRR